MLDISKLDKKLRFFFELVNFLRCYEKATKMGREVGPYFDGRYYIYISLCLYNLMSISFILTK